MTPLVAALVAIIAVPIWDRACLYRASLGASGADYRYWPLSKARLASLGLLFLMVWLVLTFSGHCLDYDGKLRLFLVAGGAVLVWAIVAFLDVIAQSRRANSAYSDRES